MHQIVPKLGEAAVPKAVLELLAIGLFGGLGAGLALLVGWELIARAIHGEGGVARVMGAPPLVVVPVLKTDSDFDLLRLLSRLLPERVRSAAPLWGRA